MAQGHEIMTVNSYNGGQITGWGIALGNDLVTNHDLASRMDTSDEWIKERTGISERRIGGTTAGLAVQAAKDAGINKSSLIEISGIGGIFSISFNCLSIILYCSKFLYVVIQCSSYKACYGNSPSYYWYFRIGRFRTKV